VARPGGRPAAGSHGGGIRGRFELCPRDEVGSAWCLESSSRANPRPPPGWRFSHEAEETEGFDGAAHKEAWQDDAIWRPARELVETLTAVRDWDEALFVTTMVFELLVGELFRSGSVMQAAAPQGDFVTPTIMFTRPGRGLAR